MASTLDHAPVVEHEDAIGADHAGEPVREDQRGAPAHQPIECFLDDGFAFRVDGRQRFVEHEDGRVAQQRARDRDALALAPRQPHAALADDGLIALRQLRDELVRVRRARRRFELRGGGARLAHPQVVLDRAMEEVGVLTDHGDVAAHLVEGQHAHVTAADQDASLLRIV